MTVVAIGPNPLHRNLAPPHRRMPLCEEPSESLRRSVQSHNTNSHILPIPDPPHLVLRVATAQTRIRKRHSSAKRAKRCLLREVRPRHSFRFHDVIPIGLQTTIVYTSASAFANHPSTLILPLSQAISISISALFISRRRTRYAPNQAVEKALAFETG